MTRRYTLSVPCSKCHEDYKCPPDNSPPVNIRTVKVTKSKAADNIAAGESAVNDPNVMYRVQSPDPGDIKQGSRRARHTSAPLSRSLLKTRWVFRQKYAYAAWLTLHFLLIVSVSCRDTFRVVAEGPTILPVSFKNFSQKAEAALSAALGQKLPASNPVREALNTYVQLAGIETGYGYFAPNVPGGYRLVFELHYRGRTSRI